MLILYRRENKASYPGKKWPDLDEQMQMQVSKGNVKISDNWEDYLVLPIPPVVLEAKTQRFNYIVFLD